MKRYYLSKIFLDTTGDFPAWRHKLQKYPGVDYLGGEIKTDPVTGLPTEKALLVLVRAKDHAKLVGDPDLVAVPAGRDSLNTVVGATDTPTKLAFRAQCKAIGFDPIDVELTTDNISSWRQVVNNFGARNNPAFDANNFDLDEN